MHEDDERIDPDFRVEIPKKVIFRTADMVAEIEALKESLKVSNQVAEDAYRFCFQTCTPIGIQYPEYTVLCQSALFWKKQQDKQKEMRR